MKALIGTSVILAVAAMPLWAQAQTTTIIERRPAIVAPPVDDLDADIDESTGAVDLTPDQDVIVRRRIIEERTAPVTIEIPRGQIRIGSRVPGDVPLHAMSGIGSQRLANLVYFISPDDKIVVVEPQTRRVVRIIQQD